MVGIRITATRVMAGAASFSISSHLPAKLCSKMVKPR